MPVEPVSILIVDDEATVRAYLRRILESDGFQILDAADGFAGLDQLSPARPKIHLLLTDIRMPAMDGCELARRTYLVQPELPVIYISGYPFDVEQERRQYGDRACAFLLKPFTPAALLEAVRGCLAAARKRVPDQASAAAPARSTGGGRG